MLGTNSGATIVNRAEVRDIQLGEIPGGLVVKPTLVWMLASDRSGKERSEISYLTDNINWHAEYVTVVNKDDTRLGVNGWVSLDNRSGATSHGRPAQARGGGREPGPAAAGDPVR